MEEKRLTFLSVFISSTGRAGREFFDAVFITSETYNTGRIRKSLECGSWFTNSFRVLPISCVVYQPVNLRNFWSIANESHFVANVTNLIITWKAINHLLIISVASRSKITPDFKIRRGKEIMEKKSYITIPGGETENSVNLKRHFLLRNKLWTSCIFYALSMHSFYKLIFT